MSSCLYVVVSKCPDMLQQRQHSRSALHPFCIHHGATVWSIVTLVSIKDLLCQTRRCMAASTRPHASNRLPDQASRQPNIFRCWTTRTQWLSSFALRAHLRLCKGWDALTVAVLDGSLCRTALWIARPGHRGTPKSAWSTTTRTVDASEGCSIHRVANRSCDLIITIPREAGTSGETPWPRA
jgi:hypothetical protein